jgi:hypothetical protein
VVSWSAGSGSFRLRSGRPAPESGAAHVFRAPLGGGMEPLEPLQKDPSEGRWLLPRASGIECALPEALTAETNVITR